MPPTIHEPPKAPMSSRMMMPPLTPPILLDSAFSKSVHVVIFLISPMLTQTAVATMSEICEAPESVSSPKIETTTEMSATRITSGTHESQRGGRRFTLRYLVELLDNREDEESSKETDAHQGCPDNPKRHIPHVTRDTDELVA